MKTINKFAITAMALGMCLIFSAPSHAQQCVDEGYAISTFFVQMPVANNESHRLMLKGQHGIITVENKITCMPVDGATRDKNDPSYARKPPTNIHNLCKVIKNGNKTFRLTNEGSINEHAFCSFVCIDAP